MIAFEISMGCSGGSREELCQIDTIPPRPF